MQSVRKVHTLAEEVEGNSHGTTVFYFYIGRLRRLPGLHESKTPVRLSDANDWES